MTKEEKREYAAQYRREGYGANADARYRERWRERVRERDRERKRAKRAQFYGMSMARYMRWLWNNPQAGQSPYTMFEGVMEPDGKDENGDIIYKYNKSKTICTKK